VEAGYLKHWNDTKGYGFVSADSGGLDLFIHRKALGQVPLSVGDRIEFEVAMGDRGPYVASGRLAGTLSQEGA